MQEELTPEEQFAAEDPETMVPRELSRGRSRDELVAELVRLDWSPAAAASFVDRVADDLRRFSESPESRQALLREACREMLAGCALTLLGVGVVVALFVLAWAEGIVVVVLSAGLAVGLAVFARGWARWRLYRRDALPFQGVPPAEQVRGEPSGRADPPRE
jgi:hypothetical protein